jgi:hypothetical protein
MSRILVGIVWCSDNNTPPELVFFFCDAPPLLAFSFRLRCLDFFFGKLMSDGNVRPHTLVA